MLRLPVAGAMALTAISGGLVLFLITGKDLFFRFGAFIAALVLFLGTFLHWAMVLKKELARKKYNVAVVGGIMYLGLFIFFGYSVWVIGYEMFSWNGAPLFMTKSRFWMPLGVFIGLVGFMIAFVDAGIKIAKKHLTQRDLPRGVVYLVILTVGTVILGYIQYLVLRAISLR